MPAFDEAKTICLEKTQSALYIACKVNDLEKVNALLTIKELIPSPSLIIAAAQSKSLNMVEFICKVLEGNVSYSDAYKWNAAHYAASTNSLDIIRFFHEQYPDLLQEYTGVGMYAGDESIVLVAARYNAPTVLQFLCANKYELDHVDVKGWTALNRAYSNSNLPLFTLLLEGGANPNSYYNATTKDNLIHKACYDNKFDYAKVLLATNKVELDHVDAKGWTALNAAYYNANLPLFTLLLEGGANPNSYYNATTKDNLIHKACYDNKIDYAKALLATNKVELDHVDAKGWTALNAAYYNANLPLFTLLLENGANPNSYYDKTTEYSLMHQACYYNQVDYVKALLATKAVILSKDSSGKLPTDIANANAKDGTFFSGNASAKEIVKLLAEYEAGSQCKANNSNAFNCK